MSGANRIAGNRREDTAVRFRIRIKSDASSIRKWIARETDARPIIRIRGRLH